MKAAFVCVHGAWHSSATWEKLMPLLAERGHALFSLDLPGAGQNAKAPASFGHRPFDRAAFAVEPSPNAGVSQGERTEAVISLVEKAAYAGDGRVVLVGHSLGGLTISDVAEEAPEMVHRLVYLTGFLLSKGMPAIEMIQHEIMSTSGVPGLLMADPAKVGALRINVASEDPEYRAKLKDTFYGDVAEPEFSRITRFLHCDEPAAVVMAPSAVTSSRHGSLKRDYIRCLGDRAIPISGQDYMIRTFDAAMGGGTTVHTLETSHCPFASQPAALAQVLAEIGG